MKANNIIAEAKISMEADLDAASAKYERMRPSYERLSREVQHILKTKLEEFGLYPVSISSRAKEVSNFAEKVTRKKYSMPLDQMTDLAGARVVCAYEAQLADVAGVIEANFDVRERIDKSRELGIDRMGYNGKAFVVVLGNRYGGGRYEGITKLTCEIQLRTILQDAWAMIGHQLVYKREELTPERLRRDLYNVASLLEIAQGIFDSVREKRAAYLGEIQRKQKDPPAFLAQPLDFDTVIAYTRWKFPSHKVSEKLTQTLLRDMSLARYPTLQQLDVAVDQAAAAVDAYGQENPGWFETGTDYLTKSLGFVDADFRRKHAFGDRTRAAFRKYGNLVGK